MKEHVHRDTNYGPKRTLEIILSVPEQELALVAARAWLIQMMDDLLYLIRFFFLAGTSLYYF